MIVGYNSIMSSAYNLRTIRKLVNEVYNLEDLRLLCYETPAFRPVYDNFGEERKDVLVRRLLEHCERKGLLDTLLSIIAEEAPDVYAGYKDRSGGSSRSSMSAGLTSTSSDSAVEHTRALITTLTRRLHTRQLQAAQYGLSTPPEITLED